MNTARRDTARGNAQRHAPQRTVASRPAAPIRLLQALVAAAVALVSPAATADLAAGLGAIERSDYARAHRELAPLAEQGDLEAQYAMGRLFLYGWGVRADPQAAAHWFTRAAEGGHDKARRMIAELHERGLGVPADPAAAQRWRCLADQAVAQPRESAPRFSREWRCEAVGPAELGRIRAAAEAGDTTSKNLLGTLLAQGKGVAADPKDALRWLRDAAQHGDAEATHNLGVMHELGLGVPQDYRAARTWYLKSAWPDARRGAHRIDLLLGVRGLPWETPLSSRAGFVISRRPPVLLVEQMRLQYLLSGRQQYAFYERRDEALQFDAVTVKRIVYQAPARNDALCALWIDFVGKANFESLAATLAARHGPPQASSGLGDGFAAMHRWTFRGGVNLMLHHFQPGAADESMGVLAIWRSSC